MTKLGLVLPTTLPAWAGGDDPRALLDLAVEAESLGFDSLWAGDTLLRPVVEPLATLSAVAAVTHTIGLGTATLLPALRRPVQTAHALAALDRLSGGRLTVAVGAGFPKRSEHEYALSEVPWERRFARLDDTVARWRRMWAGEEEGAPVLPAGPAIWFGGSASRVGGLYDGWLPYTPEPRAYADGLATIGRPVTAALYATVLIGSGSLDEYVRTAYGMPREVVEKIQLLIAGPPGHIRETLSRYTGVEHLVIRIGALDLKTQRAQLALLREEI